MILAVFHVPAFLPAGQLSNKIIVHYDEICKEAGNDCFYGGNVFYSAGTRLSKAKPAIQDIKLRQAVYSKKYKIYSAHHGLDNGRAPDCGAKRHQQ